MLIRERQLLIKDFAANFKTAFKTTNKGKLQKPYRIFNGDLASKRLDCSG
jgi:hypothetical protein